MLFVVVAAGKSDGRGSRLTVYAVFHHDSLVLKRAPGEAGEFAAVAHNRAFDKRFGKIALFNGFFLIIVSADTHTVHCVFNDAVLHVYVAHGLHADSHKVVACKRIFFGEFRRLDLDVSQQYARCIFVFLPFQHKNVGTHNVCFVGCFVKVFVLPVNGIAVAVKACRERERSVEPRSGFLAFFRA